jgi:hypothetical protein
MCSRFWHTEQINPVLRKINLSHLFINNKIVDQLDWCREEKITRFSNKKYSHEFKN